LDGCRSIVDVAEANEVAIDDEFLLSAITMMIGAGLLREST
jgi:hypothetical protein